VDIVVVLLDAGADPSLKLTDKDGRYGPHFFPPEALGKSLPQLLELALATWRLC